MSLLLYAVPLLLMFEMWQLVMGERYLGVRHFARDVDPRELGLRESTALVWTLGIALSWLYMFLLLADRSSRLQGLCMIATSFIGFSLRRNCRMQAVLAILVVEGAIRIGMLVSLIGMAMRPARFAT